MKLLKAAALPWFLLVVTVAAWVISADPLPSVFAKVLVQNVGSATLCTVFVCPSTGEIDAVVLQPGESKAVQILTGEDSREVESRKPHILVLDKESQLVANATFVPRVAWESSRLEVGSPDEVLRWIPSEGLKQSKSGQ